MNEQEYNINNKTVLHKVAQDVTPDDDVSSIVRLMFKALDDSPIAGIGLAAPQIGISKRIIILIHNKVATVLINPIIKPKNLGVTTSREGCLSYPGKIVKKKRHKMIVITGLHSSGTIIKLKLRGLDAFVAQHEVDHLNGITIGGKSLHKTYLDAMDKLGGK